MKTYVITGATGHIGHRIAETLLESGAKVKVVGRNVEKLEPLVKKGAKAFMGTLGDVEFLSKVLHGADAVFTMIPPDLHTESVRAEQTRIGISIAEAVRLSSVKWVVNLSSQGAHLLAGTGPIAGLHEQEERINGIPLLNVVHLRPAFFMENLESTISLIKTQGIMGTPLRGDLKIPVIATRDIAHAASEYLSELRFTGKSVCDLLGHRDLSMIEMTEIIGKAIAKPDLQYVQFSYEAARLAMLGMGMSADMVRVFIEMYQALNEGRLMQGVVRTIENTTKTPFENFAVEFAHLYQSHTSEIKNEEPKEKEVTPRMEEKKSQGSWWSQLHLRRKAA